MSLIAFLLELLSELLLRFLSAFLPFFSFKGTDVKSGKQPLVSELGPQAIYRDTQIH